MIYDRNSATKIYDRMIKYFILYMNKLTKSPIGNRAKEYFTKYVTVKALQERNLAENINFLKFYISIISYF